MSTQETARFEVSLILSSDGELPEDQGIIELIEDGVSCMGVEPLSVTIKERTGDLTRPDELTTEDREQIEDLLSAYDAALDNILYHHIPVSEMQTLRAQIARLRGKL